MTAVAESTCGPTFEQSLGAVFQIGDELIEEIAQQMRSSRFLFSGPQDCVVVRDEFASVYRDLKEYFPDSIAWKLAQAIRPGITKLVFTRLPGDQRWSLVWY